MARPRVVAQFGLSLTRSPRALNQVGARAGPRLRHALNQKVTVGNHHYPDPSIPNNSANAITSAVVTAAPSVAPDSGRRGPHNPWSGRTSAMSFHRTRHDRVIVWLPPPARRAQPGPVAGGRARSFSSSFRRAAIPAGSTRSAGLDIERSFAIILRRMGGPSIRSESRLSEATNPLEAAASRCVERGISDAPPMSADHPPGAIMLRPPPARRGQPQVRARGAIGHRIHASQTLCEVGQEVYYGADRGSATGGRSRGVL